MTGPSSDEAEERLRATVKGLDRLSSIARGQSDLAKVLGGQEWAKSFPDLLGTSSAIAKLAGLQSQWVGPDSPSARLAATQAALLKSNSDLARLAEQAGGVGASKALAKLIDESSVTAAHGALSSIAVQPMALGSLSAIDKLNQAALEAAGLTGAMEAAIASARSMPKIDALGPYNFTQPYGEILRNVSAFGSAFEQNRARLLELAKHIGRVGPSQLPPNWQGVNLPTTLEGLLIDEGLPLAWVPPADVLQRLFLATSAGQRRQIISANRKRITEACIAELEDISLGDKARQAWVDDFALEAAYALREGRWRASQALSANLLDSVLSNAIEESARAEVKSNKKKIDWESYPVKPALVLGALYGIHAQYFPSRGDSIPTKFSRHASVHGVSIKQYKQVNALLALMHVVGLLRLVEEESHPVKRRRRRTR